MTRAMSEAFSAPDPEPDRGPTAVPDAAAATSAPGQSSAGGAQAAPARVRATPPGSLPSALTTPRADGEIHTDGARRQPVGRVLVCIPTYNERDSLPDTIRRLRQAVPDSDVLVIDDGSPDGTGQLAEEMGVSDPGIHVLHRTAKAGLGAAYIAGFAWGREHGYDALVEMDADGSHQPEELPRLLEALETADVVLGSRWVPGGEVHNWPASRLWLSRGGNAYVRLALGMPLRDATGGYRAYRRHVLEALPLAEVASQGYCFQVDLAWQAWRSGFEVAEVPITFVERTKGESKMSRSIVLEALWRVTWWGVRSARSRRHYEVGPPPDPEG